MVDPPHLGGVETFPTQPSVLEAPPAPRQVGILLEIDKRLFDQDPTAGMLEGGFILNQDIQSQSKVIDTVGHF